MEGHMPRRNDLPPSLPPGPRRAPVLAVAGLTGATGSTLRLVLRMVVLSTVLTGPLGVSDSPSSLPVDGETG